ncbi:hypothetical protein CBR_g29424 [Chara braunii]|uniref:Uncharacterized protein n=1 Tax=Chara braunii TaxID=69332 RepID=A0A388LAG3_CHABU|nr:hypothetical protein CBR_g29424 [Chara braunii]|eukprot:GBG79274.1 hypothetical protein CBR_g29424 [Chara braunii]
MFSMSALLNPNFLKPFMQTLVSAAIGNIITASTGSGFADSSRQPSEGETEPDADVMEPQAEWLRLMALTAIKQSRRSGKAGATTCQTTGPQTRNQEGGRECSEDGLDADSTTDGIQAEQQLDHSFLSSVLSCADRDTSIGKRLLNELVRHAYMFWCEKKDHQASLGSLKLSHRLLMMMSTQKRSTNADAPVGGFVTHKAGECLHKLLSEVKAECMSEQDQATAAGPQADIKELVSMYVARVTPDQLGGASPHYGQGTPDTI